MIRNEMAIRILNIHNTNSFHYYINIYQFVFKLLNAGCITVDWLER